MPTPPPPSKKKYLKIRQVLKAWRASKVGVQMDGLVARMPAALVAKLGQKARLLQGGHLQAYTFLLGAGVLLAIYVLAFVLPRLDGPTH